MSDSFYIILPSNSSMSSFPGNSVANYTTQLCNPMNLSGHWELALLEIHFPNTFFNMYQPVQTGVQNLPDIIESSEQVNVADRTTSHIDIHNVAGNSDRIKHGPSHIYVYCDLVEPQIVGDTLAPIIRMVNTDYSKYELGANITKSFTSLQYVPVMKLNFSTVEMDLRDSTGKLIPFCSGHSAITLHLRRCLPRGRSAD